MNYAALKATNVKLLLVDEVQAGAMCGKVTVFAKICETFKIKPVVQWQSVKLFSVKQIETAVGQMELGEHRETFVQVKA